MFVGASAMSWKVQGVKTHIEAALQHDIAAGPFALCSAVTVFSGSASQGLSFTLNPQLQVAKALLFFATTGITASGIDRSVTS